jgi:hypothetical protein
MDLGEKGWSSMDWSGLAQDREKCMALVNALMNVGVPYNAGKFLRGRTTGALLISAQLRRVSC